jgi:16S rRNA processing protein RimM
VRCWKSRSEILDGDVFLGDLVKAVGLRGEIKLRAGEDFWEAALDSDQLFLESGTTRRPVRIEAARPHGPGMHVVHLHGVEDRNSAESLIGGSLVLAGGGVDVQAPSAARPFQLRGLRVELLDGTEVGEVAAVLRMPAQEVLVVRGADREHLVPNVAPIVSNIDWEGRVMRIDPPAGLLEL